MVVFRVEEVIRNIKTIKFQKQNIIFCSNKIIYLSDRTLQFNKYSLSKTSQLLLRWN